MTEKESILAPIPGYRKSAALPGFEHINRYWDKTREVWGAKILPGQYYVTIQEELIVTVLGSCVAACVRDSRLGVGGMNHFMLPTSSHEGRLKFGSVAERYGNFAMEHMINDILKNGGRREFLEVKVFGGGKILAQMTDIGQRNIDFIRQYLRTEAMKVLSEDLGDVFPRKVVYVPASGKAYVKRLRSLNNDTVVERERSYMSQLATEPVQGDVELF